MLGNPNGTRYRRGQRQGHYESFFLRANHPARALAFWIRYTVFSPARQPDRAIGELWAVIANGESGRHVAVKKELPIGDCEFKADRLAVKIGEATLDERALHGAASSDAHQVRWNLRCHGGAPPVLLLPERLYGAKLPRAKSLVPAPMARFNGLIHVDGETLAVENWVGSQNHNWGSRHTDRYAFGQVCGFDNAPDSFLEIATARIRLGPLWTPAMTPMVLRHGGREFALNGAWQSLRAKASYRYFDWRFRCENSSAVIEGRISAAPSDFVGLRYYNPPGGVKWCLNSKLAACTLRLHDKGSGRTEELVARHRAAFEILTDDEDHGVRIQA